MLKLLPNAGAWLPIDPREWDTIAEYIEMRDIVCSLSVVNDTAERAVKKMTEYENSTKDEHWGHIVEFSSWHHGKMSKYTKEELEANVLYRHLCRHTIHLLPSTQIVNNFNPLFL